MKASKVIVIRITIDVYIMACKCNSVRPVFSIVITVSTPCPTHVAGCEDAHINIACTQWHNKHSQTNTALGMKRTVTVT